MLATINYNRISDEEIDDEVKGKKTDNNLCCAEMRKTKNKIMLVGTSWIFINGLDRSICLPTLWLYLQNRFSTETANQYYGVTLALPNVLSLVASPLFAFIAQKKFARVKTVIVVTNFLPILGNLLYFMGFNPWLILIGRGMGGIGQCLSLILLAELARCTTRKERTAYAAVWLMARQVGYALGPGLNIIMHTIKFRCFGFLVDVYNSPGFFIATLRALNSIAALIVYPHLNYKHLNEDGTCKECKDVCESKTESSIAETEDEEIEKAEGASTSCLEITKQLINLESLSFFIMCFVGYFCLLAFESSLPLVFHKYFGWDEKFTSIVFICMAAMLILTYLIVSAISSMIQDRNLLLSGLLVLAGTYIFLAVSFIFINSEQRPLYIALSLVGVFTFTVGQPMAFSATDSLLTKVIPMEIMESAQAVRNCVVVSGCMLGSLVSGYTDGWVVMTVNSALLLVAVTMTAVIYRRLKS